MKLKQKIKGYLVFTPFGYKIILFAVLPLVLLGLQLVISMIYQGTGLPLFGGTLVLVEILADNWFLGGIQDKNSEKIDYLKTSGKGMRIMKNVLITDVVRRFLSCAVILGMAQAIAQVCACAAGVSEKSRIAPLQVLFVLLLTYTLSALGVFLARFTSYLWVNLLYGYIGSIVGLTVGLIWISLALPGALAAGAVFFLAVLAVGISVLMVAIAMIKVEGSYYDK